MTLKRKINDNNVIDNQMISENYDDVTSLFDDDKFNIKINDITVDEIEDIEDDIDSDVSDSLESLDIFDRAADIEHNYVNDSGNNNLDAGYHNFPNGPNGRNIDDEKKLYKKARKAIKRNDKKKLNNYINQGINDYNRLLMYASKYDNKYLMILFMTKNITNWNLPLIGASRGGHLDLVENFIGKGADDYETSIINSIKGGHRHIFNYLIKKGVNNIDQCLLSAVKYKHRKILKSLIKYANQNNIELPVELYCQALCLSIQKDYSKIIKTLIKIHHNYSNKSKDDWNKVMIVATEQGYYNLIKLCLEKGADDITNVLIILVNAKDKDMISFMMKEIIDNDIDIKKNIDWIRIINQLVINKDIKLIKLIMVKYSYVISNIDKVWDHLIETGRSKHGFKFARKIMSEKSTIFSRVTQGKANVVHQGPIDRSKKSFIKFN